MKPANVIHFGRAIKVIDLGAVRAIGDRASAYVYTAGFAPPKEEIDRRGWHIDSDLYTVGMTLQALARGTEAARGLAPRLLPPPHRPRHPRRTPRPVPLRRRDVPPTLGGAPRVPLASVRRAAAGELHPVPRVRRQPGRRTRRHPRPGPLDRPPRRAAPGLDVSAPAAAEVAGALPGRSRPRGRRRPAAGHLSARRPRPGRPAVAPPIPPRHARDRPVAVPRLPPEGGADGRAELARRGRDPARRTRRPRLAHRLAPRRPAPQQGRGGPGRRPLRRRLSGPARRVRAQARPRLLRRTHRRRAPGPGHAVLRGRLETGLRAHRRRVRPGPRPPGRRRPGRRRARPGRGPRHLPALRRRPHRGRPHPRRHPARRPAHPGRPAGRGPAAARTAPGRRRRERRVPGPAGRRGPRERPARPAGPGLGTGLPRRGPPRARGRGRPAHPAGALLPAAGRPGPHRRGSTAGSWTWPTRSGR